MMKQDDGFKVIVHKKITYCIVGIVSLYWIFTLIFLCAEKSLTTFLPKEIAFYKIFIRQDWRLFTKPPLHKRHIDIVVSDIADPTKNDTTGMMAYILENSRRHAPFNNYDDILSNLLLRTTNNFEMLLGKQLRKLKNKQANQTDSFYRIQAGLILEADIKQKPLVQNLFNFGKFIIRSKGVDTSSKVFKIIIYMEDLPPAKQTNSSWQPGLTTPIFTSSFNRF